MKRIDITGQRFGRLIAIKSTRVQGKQTYWECMCDCGSVVEISLGNLRSGNTTSCGCALKDSLIKRNLTHNLSKTKLYYVHNTMRQRCGNPNNTSYPRYGGRGITVCEEWMNFESFYNWAIESGYKEGLSIDRIDNDGNYEPSNCRWETPVNQARNRRAKGKLKETGISKRKNGQYWARITVNGITFDLGSYDTLEEAIEARKDGENKHFK